MAVVTERSDSSKNELQSRQACDLPLTCFKFVYYLLKLFHFHFTLFCSRKNEQ